MGSAEVSQAGRAAAGDGDTRFAPAAARGHFAPDVAPGFPAHGGARFSYPPSSLRPSPSPPLPLDPGQTTDPGLGRPKSMRFINGRYLRTPGEFRSLSPAERTFLDDQVLDWLAWPGHDRGPSPCILLSRL